MIMAFIQVSVLRNINDNGLYSSFCLKTRFWGPNDKNLSNFGVTTDMLFVI